MRIDLQVRDPVESIKAIIRGLDNRLTASENMVSEGPRGSILTSQGPGVPPSFDPPSDAIPDATADLASLTLTINQILATLRAKGIIES